MCSCAKCRNAFEMLHTPHSDMWRTLTRKQYVFGVCGENNYLFDSWGAICFGWVMVLTVISAEGRVVYGFLMAGCNLDARQPYINYLCVEGAKQPRCIPSLTPLSCGSQLQQSPPPPPPPFVCVYSTSCAHTHPNQQLEMRFSQVHNPIVLLSWD